MCRQEVPLILHRTIPPTLSLSLPQAQHHQSFTSDPRLRNTYGRSPVLYDLFLILSLSICLSGIYFRQNIYNTNCHYEEMGFKLLCLCHKSVCCLIFRLLVIGGNLASSKSQFLISMRCRSFSQISSHTGENNMNSKLSCKVSAEHRQGKSVF